MNPCAIPSIPDDPGDGRWMSQVKYFFALMLLIFNIFYLIKDLINLLYNVTNQSLIVK